MLKEPFINNLIARIKSCSTIQEFEKEMAEVNGLIQDQANSIASNLKSLEAALGILVAPSANPIAIVQWISKLIQYLKTQIATPYQNYVLQYAQLINQANQISSIANETAQKLSSSLNVNVVAPQINVQQGINAITNNLS